MWLTQLLERNRQCFPDRAAIVTGTHRVTWRELDRRVHNIAGGLLKANIGHGDRVAILSQDRQEVLEAYFALARVGAAFVPINHSLTEGEVRDIADRAGVTALIGEERFVERHADDVPLTISFDEFADLAEVPFDGTFPEVRIDDLAAILHTSATTGRPKGVVVDHRSIKDISLGWLAVAAPSDDMVLVNCCPLFHGSMVVSLTYMAAGATVVLLPGFTPQGALRAIETNRATHVWLVPEMLRFLLRAAALPDTDVTSLREVMYGAAPMPPELYATAARTLGCGFRQVYGQTEVGGPFVTLGPDEHPDPDSPDAFPAGRAIPGMSVRVVDEDGNQLIDAIGEVVVRGDGLMRGYWNDPQATASVIRGGWMHTGDLGRMDDRGYVHLVDRKTDMIIRGGQNVYPAEIERVLRGHRAVAEAGVVGVPDADWGEVPLAFVVLRPGELVTTAELFDHLVTNLASYKRPSGIHFIDALPRNPAGKVLKKVLRATAGAL